MINKIPSEIRRKIFDELILNKIEWYGNVEQPTFLSRIFNFDTLRSTDPRFVEVDRDIYQHTVKNHDWEDDWVFSDSRFNLGAVEDNIFLKFLAETLHPLVRSSEADIERMLTIYNKHLNGIGYCVIQSSEINGKRIFEGQAVDVVELMKEMSGSKINKLIITSKNIYEQSKTIIDKVGYLVLEKQIWDDYGYETLFSLELYYNRKLIRNIGKIKIGAEGIYTTLITQNYTQLPTKYYSLGQSDQYYENIKSLDKQLQTKILIALNDLVYNRKVAGIENLSVFIKSLARTTAAYNAYNEQPKSFDKSFRPIKNNLVFGFRCQLESAMAPHCIKFDFERNELPSRINVLIGKNGTGKTQLLTKLAEGISGESKTNQDTFNNIVESLFTPHRPIFRKVVTVSYSAFDDFYKKEQLIDNSANYSHFGLVNKDGIVDKAAMEQIIADSIRLIFLIGKENFWKEVVTNIIPIELNITSEVSTGEIIDQLRKLSSGQMIILSIITAIIAALEEGTILLIDEPELHLHPNAISKLIAALSTILEEYNSYSIIATHSPIILQEIPSKYVQVIDREGDYPIVRKLNIECLGENLSVLTDEVFGTDVESRMYKEILNKLAETKSFEEIMQVFQNKLSLNARIYLHTIIKLNIDETADSI